MRKGFFLGGGGVGLGQTLYKHRLIQPCESSREGVFFADGETEAQQSCLASGCSATPISLTSKSSLSANAATPMDVAHNYQIPSGTKCHNLILLTRPRSQSFRAWAPAQSTGTEHGGARLQRRGAARPPGGQQRARAACSRPLDASGPGSPAPPPGHWGSYADMALGCFRVSSY